MPYVNIRITREGATAAQKAQLIAGVTELLRDVLGFHLGSGDNRVHGLWATAEVEAAGDKPLALGLRCKAKKQVKVGQEVAGPHESAYELDRGEPPRAWGH